MRKFLLELSLFALPIFIVMYFVDTAVSKYLQNSKDYAFGEINVWRDIFDGNINADLLVYGSSRAFVNISPQIIEDRMHISAYNLGIDGHNFWLQFLRHKEFLKYNRKPNFIIMSVDAFTLEKRKDLYNKEQFLPYLLWNKDIYLYTSGYDGFSVADYCIPLIRYLKEGKPIVDAIEKVKNKEVNCNSIRYKGYKGYERNWNDDLEKAKANASHYEINIDEETTRLFEQFIHSCKKDNIKILFLYTPEYVEGQLYIKNRKEIISKYQYLANKYSLPFIDYSDDSICMEKRFFYNAEHLNKLGSEVFTNKLVKDLHKLKKRGLFIK